MKSFNYVEIASKIKARREELRYSFQDLADITGMSKSTLQRYEVGSIKNIPIARLRALSEALQFEPMELIGFSAEAEFANTIDTPLSGEAQKIGRAYDIAPLREKEIVDRVLEPYMEEYSEELEPRILEFPKVGVTKYDIGAAAGLGNYLGEDVPCDVHYYPADAVPTRTDFAVRVSGDSMEPDFEDGDTVFVQSCIEIENGEIGIFVVDGDAYIKKLYKDPVRKEARLVSLNPQYKDKVLDGDMDARTVGRVLGVAPRDEE